MNWQEIAVGILFIISVWTIVKVFLPEKSASGCAGKSCHCPHSKPQFKP